MTAIYIKPVTAFSCRYGNSYFLVRSKHTARNKIAWRIVFERYDNREHSKELPQRYKCECNEIRKSGYDGFLDSPEWLCPVHSVGDGYLRRLHDRLVVWLEKGYVLPTSRLMDEAK